MEQKENTGVLFKNDFKKTEKQPHYKGSCFIKGEKMEISAWLNESKDGKKYMGLQFSEPYQAEVEAGYGHKPKDNEDLPF